MTCRSRLHQIGLCANIQFSHTKINISRPGYMWIGQRTFPKHIDKHNDWHAERYKMHDFASSFKKYPGHRLVGQLSLASLWARWWINRVPASAGVKAGKSPLPCGRCDPTWHCVAGVIPHGIVWFLVAVRWFPRTAISASLTLLPDDRTSRVGGGNPFQYPSTQHGALASVDQCESQPRFSNQYHNRPTTK